MPHDLPAISLVAVPGRRLATLDAAREIERAGFAGIYAPSIFGNLSLCEALAHVTDRIPFATSVTPIYQRTVSDFAQTAAFVHEISGARFSLGIGVSHAPAHVRMGVSPGPPLSDIRNFIARLRSEESVGPLPPIIVAGLRRRMVALAGEIADGVVFANGSLSHMAESLDGIPAERQSDPDFFVGNMIPTCISNDLAAARAVHRRSLTHYAMLPNYRNYWREAGYGEEMDAIEAAISENRTEDIPRAMSDRWLDDCTLSGSAARVRDGVEAWRAAGIKTPILVPSSAAGNQMAAIGEVIAAFRN